MIIPELYTQQEGRVNTLGRVGRLARLLLDWISLAIRLGPYNNNGYHGS